MATASISIISES